MSREYVLAYEDTKDPITGEERRFVLYFRDNKGSLKDLTSGGSNSNIEDIAKSFLETNPHGQIGREDPITTVPATTIINRYGKRVIVRPVSDDLLIEFDSLIRLSR